MNMPGGPGAGLPGTFSHCKAVSSGAPEAEAPEAARERSPCRPAGRPPSAREARHGDSLRV